MKKTIRLVLTSIGFLIPFGMFASASYAADEPTPPGFIESYLCNLQPGKDIDDLMSARDYYVKQSEKAGLPVQDSYVWTHYKGDSQADLIWHSLYPSMADWAAQSDAGVGKPEMANVNEKFEEVIDCQPFIGTINPVHVGKELSENTFVSSSACRAREGVNRQDVTDLVNHLRGVVATQGDAAPGFIGAIEPITGGPRVPHIVLFSVSDSASAWAGFIGGLRSGDGMLGRHFNTTLDCSLNLYGSRQVIKAG